MASWTFKQSVASYIFTGFCAASDQNDTIWFHNNAGGANSVMEYNVATDTLTAIGNTASFDSLMFFPSGEHNTIFYFKSNLYVGGIRRVFSGGNNYYIQVYRYSGTPLSWTKVFDQFVGTSVSGYGNLAFSANANEVVIIAADTNDFYSSNGSSWNSGSLAWVAGGSPSIQSNRNGIQKGIFVRLDDEVTYMYGSGGVWATAEAATSYYRLSGPDNHWRRNASNVWQYAPSFPASWTTPANTNVVPRYQIDMPNDVGYHVTGGNLNLHLFESGAWDAGEAIDTITNSVIYYAIRMGDGEGIVLAGDQVSGDIDIYKRDVNYSAILPTPSEPNANRLWIYRTADNGINWISRGVKT